MNNKFMRTVARPMPSSKKKLTPEEKEAKLARQKIHIQENYAKKALLAEAKAKETDDKEFKW
jgi:hypothetical protein